MTITSTNHNFFVSYTNIWIESMSNKMVKWKIKMNKCEHIICRIVSNDDFYHTLPNYGFSTDGQTYTNGEWTMRDMMYKSKLKQRDILTVILNTKDGSISTMRNDNDLQVVCEGIERSRDIKYKLCFQLGQDDSVTLVDFEITDLNSIQM